MKSNDRSKNHTNETVNEWRWIGKSTLLKWMEHEFLWNSLTLFMNSHHSAHCQSKCVCVGMHVIKIFLWHKPMANESTTNFTMENVKSTLMADAVHFCNRIHGFGQFWFGTLRMWGNLCDGANKRPTGRETERTKQRESKKDWQKTESN